MTIGPELFEEINNAVLDLQSSEHQTYERPLHRLWQLLQSDELLSINRKLTEGLDLQAFLKESANTQGGMVGSARLVWPKEPEKGLGLTLLLIEQFACETASIEDFGHTFFYTGRKIMGDVRSVVSQLIIPFVRDYRTYVLRQGKIRPVMRVDFARKIFIVHGHDNEALMEVARFLERTDFETVILQERPSKGRTIIEKIEANSDVGFAVVLLTPDDEGRVKGGELFPRVRQNVLLELGYFMAHLKRERVCVLKRGAVDVPTDFAGVIWIDMDRTGGWKLKLGRELMAVGFDVDLAKAA